MTYLTGIKIDESYPLVGYLSLDFTLTNFCFFVFGSMLAQNIGKFTKLMSNPFVSSALLAVALIPFGFRVPGSLGIVTKTSQVLVIFYVFWYYSVFFSKSTWVPGFLRLIGRNTLEIYLIHYFLLFKVTAFLPLLLPMTTDYCFRGHSCVFIAELALIGMTAVFISLMCVLIKKLISPFPLIGNLCLGNDFLPKENQIL